MKASSALLVSSTPTLPLLTLHDTLTYQKGHDCHWPSEARGPEANNAGHKETASRANNARYMWSFVVVSHLTYSSRCPHADGASNTGGKEAQGCQPHFPRYPTGAGAGTRSHDQGQTIIAEILQHILPFHAPTPAMSTFKACVYTEAIPRKEQRGYLRHFIFFRAGRDEPCNNDHKDPDAYQHSPHPSVPGWEVPSRIHRHPFRTPIPWSSSTLRPRNNASQRAQELERNNANPSL